MVFIILNTLADRKLCMNDLYNGEKKRIQHTHIQPGRQYIFKNQGDAGINAKVQTVLE